MRFLDSSIVISAVLKPRRQLSSQEQAVKDQAAKILQDVDGGIQVATTVVHLNEIANVIRASLGGLPVSHAVVKKLMTNPHVTICDVSRDLYFNALTVAQQASVDIADAVGWLVTRDILKVSEVYTLNRKHYAALSPGLVIFP